MPSNPTIAGLSVTKLIDQYAWLYTSLAAPSGTWDHIIPVDGAYAAVKTFGGMSVVCFRGSVTFLDWIEDFSMFATPTFVDRLGPIHPGFYGGVLAVRDMLDKVLAGKVVIVGHSLGAGHALVYAGLRAAAGKAVDGLLLFGSPRAGGPELAALLHSVPALSYRNGDADGHDLVTDVPVGFPPLINYTPSFPFTAVRHSPDPADRWGPFRYHHMGHYAAALGATGAATKTLPGYDLKLLGP